MSVQVIVDSHVHVVAGDSARYRLQPPGIGTDWYLEPALAVEDYRARMAAAGVDAAVLVQAFGAYGYDNGYVLDAARTEPARFAGVCVVDPLAAPAETLRRLVSEHGALGVRLFAIPAAGEIQPEWLDDAVTFPLWEAAGALDVRVTVAMLSPQLGGLARVLSRFPSIPVLLDHCAFPDLTGGPPYPRARALLELVEMANLHLKVTSHVLEAAARVGDARDLVDHLAGVFGSERLLWGSDHPQTHDRSYRALVELARHSCARLDEAGQARFLGGNAVGLFPSLRPA